MKTVPRQEKQAPYQIGLITGKLSVGFSEYKSNQPAQLQRLAGIYILLSFIELVIRLYRGSYMSAHVLLILLNELGKRDKMRGLSSILSLFRNEFNKVNKTRQVLDSFYHLTLILL